MITYQITKENMWDIDNGNYTSFGICAYDISNNNKKMVAYIPDIFLKEDEAKSLVDRCNKGKLSLIHLYDVIEDSLS